MIRQLYITLPVADLARSVAFFAALGLDFDPAFASEHGAAVRIAGDARVMLLARPQFAGLSHKPVADTRASAGMLLALSCDSREEVDALVSKAAAAGGSVPAPPEDSGAMYQSGFEDPDGHQWGVFWMDVDAMRAGGDAGASPPS